MSIMWGILFSDKYYKHCGQLHILYQYVQRVPNCQLFTKNICDPKTPVSFLCIRGRSVNFLWKNEVNYKNNFKQILGTNLFCFSLETRTFRYIRNTPTCAHVYYFWSRNSVNVFLIVITFFDARVKAQLPALCEKKLIIWIKARVKNLQPIISTSAQALQKIELFSILPWAIVWKKMCTLKQNILSLRFYHPINKY